MNNIFSSPIGPVNSLNGVSNTSSITLFDRFDELRMEIDELRDMITALGIENTFLKTKLNENK